MHVVVKRAQRAFQHRVLRDDVAARARVEGADGDHHAVHRGDEAGDDGLQGLHDRRARGDRVHADLRRRAVAALAVDGDLEHVRLGPDAAGRGVQRAGRIQAPDVQAVEGVHVADQPGGDHLVRAVLALLGGLKDDFICAAKRVGVRLQQAGDEHAAGGVRVVAAAVHQAVRFGFIGHVAKLLHLQRVGIKAQADGLAGFRAADDGDGDVVLRAEHVDLMRAELLANALIGAVFKVGRFGMAVEILKKGAHFAFEGLGFAQKIHGIHAFCFGMGK